MGRVLAALPGLFRVILSLGLLAKALLGVTLSFFLVPQALFSIPLSFGLVPQALFGVPSVLVFVPLALLGVPPIPVRPLGVDGRVFPPHQLLELLLRGGHRGSGASQKGLGGRGTPKSCGWREVSGGYLPAQ